MLDGPRPWGVLGAHFSSAVLSDCDMCSYSTVCVAGLWRRGRLVGLRSGKDFGLRCGCFPGAQQPEQRKRHAALISGAAACG